MPAMNKTEAIFHLTTFFESKSYLQGVAKDLERAEKRGQRILDASNKGGKKIGRVGKGNKKFVNLT